MSTTLINAIEIDVIKGEHIVTHYVNIDTINKLRSEEKRELKTWLKREKLPYYWATREYLEHVAGLYIFSSDEDLEIPYFTKEQINKIKLSPTSYPAKFLLKMLIDRELQERLKDKIEKIGEDMQGNNIYRFKKPLYSWPSSKVTIYEFYRRLFLRVEHVRHIVGYGHIGEPLYVDKLYLLPTIRLQIAIKASLGEIIRQVNGHNVLSLLHYRRVLVSIEGQRRVGLLIDVDSKENSAMVQLADGEVKLPLSDVYLQTNPTWYGEFLREVGKRCDSSYDELISKLGLLTYRFEPIPETKKRRKMYDAPAKYLEDLKAAIKEILTDIFPIKFQEVEYDLLKDFTQITKGEYHVQVSGA